MSYNLLKGKKGLIFGALNENSIAWKVARRAVEEGAEIVLTNTAVSIRMGTINQLAEQCGTIVVPADATSVPDLERLIDRTMEHFGGKFDFILHSIGMSLNVRKGRKYDDLDYDYLAKTLDISAISFHKVIQVARKKDALNDWGVDRRADVYRRPAHALRIQRHGRRQGAARVDRPQLRLYLRPREARPHQHGLAVAHPDDGRQRRHGNGRPDGFRRPDLAAGQRHGRRLPQAMCSRCSPT